MKASSLPISVTTRSMPHPLPLLSNCPSAGPRLTQLELLAACTHSSPTHFSAPFIQSSTLPAPCQGLEHWGRTKSYKLEELEIFSTYPFYWWTMSGCCLKSSTLYSFPLIQSDIICSTLSSKLSNPTGHCAVQAWRHVLWGRWWATSSCSASRPCWVPWTKYGLFGGKFHLIKPPSIMNALVDWYWSSANNVMV